MQYGMQNANRDQSILRVGTGKHGAVSNHMTAIDRRQRYAQVQRQSASKTARRQKLGEFLHVMFNAGFSQEQLASQVSNPNALRQMTVALGLHPHTSAPDSGNLDPVTIALDSVPSSNPTVAIQPKPVKKIAPAKPAGVDRSAYLAKLQAAKNKKADVVPKPAAAKAATAPKASSAMKASQPVEKTAIAPPKLSSDTKAAKDELLRQRLEAIRAAKVTTRAKTPASLPRKPGPSTDSVPQPVNGHAISVMTAMNDISQAAGYNSLTQGPLPDNVAVPAFGKVTLPTAEPTPAKSAPSATSLPTIPPAKSNTATVHSSFSGLPGLFLTPTQLARNDSQPGVNAPLPGVGDIPRIEGQSGSGSPTRALPGAGALAQVQSPAHSAFGSRDSVDEPMIITVSDDEDDDDDMDISSSDREQSSSELNRDPNSKIATPQANPARPGVHRSNTSSSAITTAPKTPKSDAYNKKLQELEVLKRRLAEIELRKQAKAVSKPDSAVVTSVPVAQDQSSSVEPAVLLPTIEPPKVDEATRTAPNTQSESTAQDSKPPPSPDNGAIMDDEQQTDGDDDDAMDMSDDATTVSSESVNDEYEPELESDSAAEVHVQPGVRQSVNYAEDAPVADNASSADDDIATSPMVDADHQSSTQQQSVERQDVSLPFLNDFYSY
jgi:hypothetical protein